MTAERRARLASALAERGIAALLVSRPSNIRYLSGFTGSAGYLLVLAEGPARLLVDVRYRDQARVQAEGVDVAGDVAPPRLWPTVAGALAELPDGCAVEAQHLPVAQYLDLRERGGRVEATRGLVEALRTVKDDREIACLRRAGEVADGVLAHLATILRPGLTELEVAGEVERRQRQLGSSGSATEVIVASGPRSALPHGRASGRVLQAGEPVMVDLSPVVEGYRGDVTRMFHLGPPGDAYLRVHELVVEAQRRAELALRPGMPASQADGVARSIIAAAGHGPHFEHSLGHGVGLDVHEPPLLSPHDGTPLAAGMVLTVEPGVYVPGVHGVRIENSVLLLDGGAEPLNRFPTEPCVVPVG